MPIYQYRCRCCHEVTEAIRPVEERLHEPACEHCGKDTYQIVAPVPTTFKFADQSAQKRERR